jgi:AraC-like DNA-binding protein/quercetin dioxygenase-like cupin family protein
MTVIVPVDGDGGPPVVCQVMLESRQPRQPRRVQPASRRRLAGGERITPHFHDQAQLIYPAYGLLGVTTERGTWMAPPHRAVWIPAGAEHQHQAYGVTDMRALLFPMGAGADLGEQPTVVAVSGLLRELILTLTGPGTRTAAARRRLERVTVDQLLESSEQPLHLPEPGDERLRVVTELLRADPGHPATLSELGRQAGASARTLSRLFASELGMSFHGWRTQLRIHHSLVLLAEGTSVTDTAIGCGWSNPSSFIDAFSRAVGQTPGRYQATLQEELPRGVRGGGA